MCTFNGREQHAARAPSCPRYRPGIERTEHCSCSLPLAAAALSFPRGQHLFHQGDPVRGVFSLTSGLVALERVNEDGDMVILKLARPGSLFPCADLFGDGTYATGARALTEASACFLPADRLMTALSDPAIAREVMAGSCNEARENENIIFRLCAGDLGERIMAVLRELAAETAPERDGSRSLTLPISWRDVAAMVGTSPEVLSRTLRRLSAHRRLGFHGRRVTLPNDAMTHPPGPTKNPRLSPGVVCWDGPGLRR